LISSIEEDRSEHSSCNLQAALRLIAGKDVRVPKLAYPMLSSRLSRAWQMGNSVSTLLVSVGSNNTLVSGEGLAYVSGELEYFSDHILSRALHCISKRQPFFVLSVNDADASIAALTGCDAVPSPKLRLSTQCVVVVTANYKGVPAILHVGACPEARAEVLRQIEGLEIAALDPALQALAPRFLSRLTSASGVEVLTETKVPGETTEFSWQRVDAVKELWLARGPATSGIARPNLFAELRDVCESLPSHRDSLCLLRDSLLDWHSRSRMPGHVAHGDLWLGNILFTGDAVTGIVDWESAHTDGLRVVDVLHLIFMSHSVSLNISVTHCFRQLWADDIEESPLRERLEELRVHFAFDRDDLKFAALLLWFDYLRQRAVRGRMPSLAWTDDMIARMMPVIAKWLNEHNKGCA
jgi:Phosphotransferase enzyme family